MKYNVIEYGTDIKLGIFLNVETVNQEVKVWYYSSDDDLIKSAYRENIYLKEIEDFGN